MKPEIFKPNIENINNNKSSFYSAIDSEIRNESPSEFIDNLSKDGYTFGKKVTIKTKDHVYNTKIIGKYGDSIITIDNDKILLKDIENISYQ